MIQFSSLSGSSPANPAKAALPGAADGAFAGMLNGEIGQEPANGGNILPDSGKDLPVPGKKAVSASGKTAKADASASPTAMEDAAANPDALPFDEQGSLPGCDSDAGPAQAVIAPAPFFLDPMIPFAASPAAPIPAEAATDGQDGAQPSARAVPQPQRTKPDFAALAAKHAAQAETQGGAKQPALPAMIDLPQELAEQAAAPKLASVARGAASREFRIELGAETRSIVAAKLGEPQMADKPSASLPFTLTAAAPVDATANPAQSVARIAAETGGAIRPHDFTALVDRLIEARDAARPHAATMAVMHAEFGEVSLRFSHTDGALSVAISNQDPEFNRAVSAAMPAERAQGDTNAQTNGNQGRREDPFQAASHGAANADASGQEGNGRHGRETHRDAIDQNNPAARSQTSAGTRGGIFA